jgi:hypothetical protein
MEKKLKINSTMNSTENEEVKRISKKKNMKDKCSLSTFQKKTNGSKSNKV